MFERIRLHRLSRVPAFAVTAVLLATLTACDDSERSGGATTEPGTVASATASGQGEPTGSEPGASCIARHAEAPCDLLTAERVRAHVPGLPADAQPEDIAASLAERGIQVSKRSRSVANGCSFSWDGGRKTPPKPPLPPGEKEDPMAAALDRLRYDRPIPDTVAFKSIRVLESEDPLAEFERRWRAPTDAQRKMLAERMEAGMEAARQEGELSDQAAAAGKSLGASMAAAEIQFEPIQGIGTAARWGGVGSDRALKVLDGDTEFEVMVDVSDDEAVDREAAIAIARDVLAQASNACD